MPDNFDFLQLDSVRGRLPIIMYELNEVPWRIVDWYVAERPNSHFAKVLDRSLTYTTNTHDSGELHPWSTWPTVHRGVYNDQHQIRFLNQDLSVADRFPPIWEILSSKGFKVGVFGSLQSYPVPSSGKYSFYVPDTFARSPETWPARYSAFQRINLKQTASDGAVASEVHVGGILFDAVRLPFLGVTPATFLRLAMHLRSERRDGQYRARRPLMQAPLAFDVFLDAWRKTEPQFSTFFTNHVAGAMHRYWRYVFPEDFGLSNKGADDRFKRETVLAAMDIADDQVGRLADLAVKKDGTLVILSSMGQEAVKRDPYQGELRLTDAERFAQAIGFSQRFRVNLAMQPDFNFEFDSEGAARHFINRAVRLQSDDGKPLFYRVRQQSATVNLSLAPWTSVLEREAVQFDDVGGLSTLKLADLGITKFSRDPGTGYHQPKGIMIWHGAHVKACDGVRETIESAHIQNLILYAMSAIEAPVVAEPARVAL
ncbi:hypothetical protein [Caballeronia grimmiae]|uniref:hypothetical protein n=1 Tax=Caballeronia grimmiae TaxID=1071679 RepID=UPI0038BC19B1